MTESSPALRARALAALRQTFGHAEFRGPQADIVEHVAGGGDALVLMPTGGGKSMCYQLPALVRDGVTVVVSPLIALMADQVTAMRALGVRAAALNSVYDTASAFSRRQKEGVVPEGISTRCSFCSGTMSSYPNGAVIFMSRSRRTILRCYLGQVTPRRASLPR